jgi:phosphoglycerate dehydrogenase-like enzyme
MADTSDRPLVVAAPEPRTLELIFTPAALSALHARYDVHEVAADALETLPEAVLAQARYIIGQPPLSDALSDRLSSLKCVFNVEGNLYDNMPYPRLFARGVHVVTTLPVFALPVAEIGLAFALDLMRGVVDADVAFREGREAWGLESNGRARLLTGADVGIIGFGEIGRALSRVLTGFHPRLRIHDPWLPASVIREAGAEPSDLATVIGESDVVFVAAAVTTENQKFLGADAFAAMRPGAAFILLSRADVVDFDALVAAVASGHIVAASDVFPEEPMPADHPVRGLHGFLRSAHRGGALEGAFKKMGDMLLEDMALLDRDLPPVRCKRAERETVARMRSRPVSVN